MFSKNVRVVLKISCLLKVISMFSKLRGRLLKVR